MLASLAEQIDGYENQSVGLRYPPRSDRILSLKPKRSIRMRNSRVIVALLAGASLAALSQGALAQAAGNAEAGKNKLAMCIGCHGIPGYRTAYPDVYHVPKIYGQQQAYIVKALQAYKTGERSHPSMRGIARGLTDADMADLAAYYGGPHK